MATIPYLSVIKSLMYIMICTRLDLAYPLNHVSQFVSNLGNGHWLAIK